MEIAPTVDTEETALLENPGNASSCHGHGTVPNEDGTRLEYILPIPLLTSLAMASTAATAYFTYRTLLCEDPHHCRGSEISRYAGFVAGATCVANLIGMSTLSFLQKLMITNRKLGLLLWMLCRSMSATILLLGVSFKSIHIALCGRLFEGIASDNLLHFTLNAVYAQSRDKKKASSLISYSLALYMVGISISPFVAGLFKNFTTSFFMAFGLFGASVTYLIAVVGNMKAKKITSEESRYVAQGESDTGFRSWMKARLNTALSPLVILRRQRPYLLVGLSLFAYNISQSYIFNALLVHTSTRFGFTGRENGFVISIAHSTAATYIFTSLWLVPRIIRRFRQKKSAATSPSYPERRDRHFALISLAFHSMSLTAVAFAKQAWQIYCITVMLAIGLSTPSFMKAFFVSLFRSEETPATLAALSVMETLGSVLGPVMLRSLQSTLPTDGSVFYTTAGLGVASFALMGAGSLDLRRHRDS